MPVLHAIVLGIVQGLSEFLPISSSGHLVLVPWFFDWDELAGNPDLSRSFDVALHVGTFVGASAYFAKDIWRLATRNRRLGVLLLLSAAPAGLVGVLVDAFLEEQLETVWLIGVMLIAFAVVLQWADRLPGTRGEGEFGPREAVFMGTAQALAIQPGVSRSGATISMARWLGFGRNAAARLSFLMSLPVIGGAGLYKGFDTLVLGDGIPSDLRSAFVWGMAAAGATGFAAVWGLLRLVHTRSFAPFVAYRIVLGAAVLAVTVIS
ncbi:MAG TPA: undecaprenyl-diphosphate phosphatase [Acidimicrobiales bacterium]|nr:undecaprenyl-diphosphate phosphatase [Acidimicrobiales bacterium]